MDYEKTGQHGFLDRASKHASKKHIVRQLCKGKHDTWVISSTVQNSHAARNMHLDVIRQPSPSSFAWFGGLSGPAVP